MYLGITRGTSGSYPQVSVDIVLKTAEVLINGEFWLTEYVSRLNCGDGYWTTLKENKLILESQLAIYFREISE